MNFSEILSLISQALVHAFAWFSDLIPGDYWLAFMAAFVMYTASRLLLMPFIGHAASDSARDSVHRLQYEVDRRRDRRH